MIPYLLFNKNAEEIACLKGKKVRDFFLRLEAFEKKIQINNT